MAFPLKTYQRNPQRVAAGKIERVYYDEDNEEVPFIVWIDGNHYGLNEEMIDGQDPQVGDWLVIPKDGQELKFGEAAILTDRMFHLLYADRHSKGAESATSIAPDLH